MKILLKEVKTLIERNGELLTPEELAKELNVDYDTYEIDVSG